MRKVKNRRWNGSTGESLAETLVAILVIALAMVMLVSMLMASNRLINTSSTVFHTNMATKNAIEEGTDSEDSTGSTKSKKVMITGSLSGDAKTGETGEDSDFHVEFSASQFQESADVWSEDGSIWRYR